MDEGEDLDGPRFDEPLEDFAEHMTTAQEEAAGIQNPWKQK